MPATSDSCVTGRGSVSSMATKCGEGKGYGERTEGGGAGKGWGGRQGGGGSSAWWVWDGGKDRRSRAGRLRVAAGPSPCAAVRWVWHPGAGTLPETCLSHLNGMRNPTAHVRVCTSNLADNQTVTG